ncbi:serine hydrolase domain-containing protein [Isoptericola haloaureus]|uniref:Serine hydrolase domain-containing protein n=1 Tax=Isoptericola haloaureus TaxID=1542902 RepID=A0ABU7ZA64_9MICO
MSHDVLQGGCDPAFRSVADRFAALVEADPTLSAQLSVRVRGEPVLDLAGGPHLTVDAVTGVYSATKGVAALVVAHLLDRGLLDPDRVVADYWPEFGAADKDQVTVRQLLSHQAGLPLVERPLGVADVVDSRAAAAVLAAQRPLWRPGSAFGYHALTIGILVEELVRRVTGRTLQTVYETSVRGPLDADLHLGLPEDRDGRYVPVRDPELTAEQAAEVAARPPADAIAEAVFSNFSVPDDRSAEGASTNNPAVRRAGFAAIGGVGSARGLAQVYAAALPGGGVHVAAPEVFAEMAQQHAWGTDRVLGVPNCFGMMFMLPQPRQPFAGLGAFGHDGAGGALAFADPRTGLAFGYVPSPMQHPGGADHRAVELARLAVAVARAAG